MVMLLMQLQKRDEAPDHSRSGRHEARVYIQHCCEPVEKRWERQKTLCTVNCVTLGYRAFWPVWKKTVPRQTGTKRYHVIRSHGGICSSTFQTHGKIWRFHWRTDPSSNNSWTWYGRHKDKWYTAPRTMLRISKGNTVTNTFSPYISLEKKKREPLWTGSGGHLSFSPWVHFVLLIPHGALSLSHDSYTLAWNPLIRRTTGRKSYENLLVFMLELPIAHSVKQGTECSGGGHKRGVSLS